MINGGINKYMSFKIANAPRKVKKYNSTKLYAYKILNTKWCKMIINEVFQIKIR